jgi:hypothetical protein
MADGDAIGSAPIRNLVHHTISKVTGFGLEGRGTTMSAEAYRAYLERNVQTPAQRFHTPLVFLGFSPS